MQKRHSHHTVHEPSNMCTCECASCITKIDDFLEDFPPKVKTNDEGAEVVTAETKLPADKILDPLKCGVPAAWQCQMILQDFDPMIPTLNEFVRFCEWLESVDDAEISAMEKKPS